MPTHRLSATALLHVPAARVYATLADYRTAHPRILPRPPFGALTVEQGGVGAGTVITFDLTLGGRQRVFHSLITEPEPGALLVETDPQANTVTTFRVEPRAGGAAAQVTITTDLPVRAGLAGQLEGWLAGQMLRPVYLKELKLLEQVASAS
jgi:hypothetical protein